MNIPALQQTLRQFAADRHWQPFHTPKNLSTALLVEAAELAEIFQWMTPEQSASAAADAAIKQHIGEEIADVLLYLLQIADHTGVDVEQAVQDKLVKNAAKHRKPGPDHQV
jgi:NTP pyrophosphatase (non-canonical NTP hydrolase)